VKALNEDGGFYTDPITACLVFVLHVWYYFNKLLNANLTELNKTVELVKQIREKIKP
jgi:hypothetical protein